MSQLTFSISSDRLKELEDSENMLNALVAAGVDNWEGYSEALRLLDEDEDDDSDDYSDEDS